MKPNSTFSQLNFAMLIRNGIEGASYAYIPSKGTTGFDSKISYNVSIEQIADGWDDLIKFGPVKFNLENILAQNLLMNAWNEDN
jgi:hypothetical protein